MKTFVVNLNSINKVYAFVSMCSQYDVDIDVISGRYKVSGKSIMGIFSLDLSRDLTVHFMSDNDLFVDRFVSDVKPFEV